MYPVDERRALISIAFSFSVSAESQELDADITMEKKSLIILQSDLNNYKEITGRVLSIISSQATSIGRFEIIDRNLVAKILEEQKFQLSGMVNDENIIVFMGAGSITNLAHELVSSK